MSLPDESQGAVVHCLRSGDFVYLVAGDDAGVLSAEAAAAFLEDLRAAWQGFHGEGEEKTGARASLLSQETAFGPVLRHLMVRR